MPELRERLLEAALTLNRYDRIRCTLDGRGGWAVQYVLERQKITRRELAKRLGVTHCYLSKIENGKMPFSVEMASRLAFEMDKDCGESLNSR